MVLVVKQIIFFCGNCEEKYDYEDEAEECCSEEYCSECGEELTESEQDKDLTICEDCIKDGYGDDVK